MTRLTIGTPEETGMDPNRIAVLQERAPQWLDPVRMRSAVFLAARHGKIVFHEAYGPLTDQPGSPPLTKDSIFNIGSITKSLTATCAMMLVEDGLLGLNRPVKEYVPEVCGEGTDDVEVQHLLSHTGGFSWDEEVEKITGRFDPDSTIVGDPATGLHEFNARQLSWLWDMKSHWAPGSQMAYCDFNFDLLAEIIRRVTGGAITDFAAQRLFKPLGMPDTTYVRNEEKMDRWVRRGDDVPFGTVSGMPIAGAEGLWHQTAPWGCGGTSSTALDMAVFGQMLLNGGTYNGNRILGRASVHEMSRNQIPGIGTDFFGTWHKEASWGLGIIVQGIERWPWSGTLAPCGTFGHGGIGSNMLWIDRINEIVGVYLTVCTDIDMETNKRGWNFDLFQNMVTAAVVN